MHYDLVIIMLINKYLCKIITESRDVFVWNLDANGRIVLRLTPDEINVISKAISRATGNGEGE